MPQLGKFKSLSLARQMSSFVEENLDALEPSLRGEAQAILDRGRIALAVTPSGSIDLTAVLAFIEALMPVIEQLIVIFNPPKPAVG